MGDSGYHGPHLSLHNDALITAGVVRDLHARLGRADWPLLRVRASSCIRSCLVLCKAVKRSRSVRCKTLRVILTFEDWMLVVTVVRLGGEEG